MPRTHSALWSSLGSRSRFTCVTLALLIPACASHDDAETTAARPPVEAETAKPQPEPEPKPDPAAAKVDITVASVQLNDDCPDPTPEPSAAPAHAEKAKSEPARAVAMGDEAAGDVAYDEERGDSYRSHCVQSTLQLSIASKAESAVAMKITEIRLLEDGGTTVLSKIDARLPTQWSDAAYLTWDENIPANGELKASYKLADPDWNAVSKATGKPAWGPTYIVELDVVVDGEQRTVRSTPVPREMPEQIQT